MDRVARNLLHKQPAFRSAPSRGFLASMAGNGSALALSSKDELVEEVIRLRKAKTRAKEAEETMLEKSFGHLSAYGGGAFGAVVRRYLPAIIPGEGAGDSAAVFGVNAAIDLAAVMMKGELATQLNYFGAGMDGYLSGSWVETILP